MKIKSTVLAVSAALALALPALPVQAASIGAAGGSAQAVTIHHPLCLATLRGHGKHRHVVAVRCF